VYQVIRRDPAGTLTVAVVDPGAGRADRGNRVMLPAEYVAVHVELEYAGTSHAAQGGTRFSSHALISERDSTSAVYVDLTRGRVSNVAHVDSEIPANDERPPTSEDPVAVLARVFNREDPGEALPAIEAQELAATNARSLRTLFPIWQDLDGQHAVTRWRRALAESQGEEFAAAVTEAAAWPTLAARLGVIEAGGGDPVDALRAAVASRTLGDAGDVAAVLHYRLEPAAGAAERAGGLHAPFSLRDIPESPYAPAMRQVAARMDRRVTELGEAAAVERPDWAAGLGPVPDDALGRLDWVDRAGIVASYREAFTVAGPDPIGDLPAAARPEARRWWTAAGEALAANEALAVAASAVELAERAAAGDRAETERPDPVDLAAAAKTDRDAHAELVFALEHQRVVATDPAATGSDIAQAADWVAVAAPAATQAVAELVLAEEALGRYRQWEARTATTRAAGESARRELAARAEPAPTGRSDFHDQPTSWVAYQAVRADQALHAKEQALRSAQEAVRRVGSRAQRRAAAGDTHAAAEEDTLLERWQADQARLEREVAEAQARAEQINSELAARAGGHEAKAAARQTPAARTPSPGVRVSPEPAPTQQPRPPTQGV